MEMGKYYNPGKPESSEYSEFYANYIQLMADDNPVACLKTDFEEQTDLLDQSPGLDLDFSYDHGKWTLRQLLIHLIDCERVMGWRLLAAVRKDPNSYPGFDYLAYAENTKKDSREWVELRKEWKAVRKSTVALVKTLEPGDWNNYCTVDGERLSARALLYIIPGHLRAHFSTIKSKYLP